MIRFIAVALGGAIGAMMRYGTSLLVNQMIEGPAPVATWTVNLTGCLLIGFGFPFLTSIPASVPVQLFLLVGFLGSLTNFYTFSMESVSLLQQVTHVECRGERGRRNVAGLGGDEAAWDIVSCNLKPATCNCKP